MNSTFSWRAVGPSLVGAGENQAALRLKFLWISRYLVLVNVLSDAVGGRLQPLQKDLA